MASPPMLPSVMVSAVVCFERKGWLDVEKAERNSGYYRNNLLPNLVESTNFGNRLFV